MTIPVPRDIVLVRNEALTPRVRQLTFADADGRPFHFTPGEWVSVAAPVGGIELWRAYSVASRPGDGPEFEIIVTRVPIGLVSDRLHDLPVGARLRMTGPGGTFRLREPVDRPSLFIATGTGIAPFRPMIDDLLVRRRSALPATLVHGVRTEPELLYRGEFESLAATHPSFRYVPVLSQPAPGWSGAAGHVGPAAEPLFQPPADRDIYLCGLRKMTDSLALRLKELGVPRDRVHVERYD